MTLQRIKDLLLVSVLGGCAAMQDAQPPLDDRYECALFFNERSANNRARATIYRRDNESATPFLSSDSGLRLRGSGTTRPPEPETGLTGTYAARAYAEDLTDNEQLFKPWTIEVVIKGWHKGRPRGTCAAIETDTNRTALLAPIAE